MLSGEYAVGVNALTPACGSQGGLPGGRAN